MISDFSPLYITETAGSCSNWNRSQIQSQERTTTKHQQTHRHKKINAKCHTVNATRVARERGSEGEREARGTVANKGESERGRQTGRYAKGFSMFNFQIGLSRMTFSWRLQAQRCLSWYWYAGGAWLVTGTNSVDEWGAFPQEGVKCKFEMREKEDGRKTETKEYMQTQIELQWQLPCMPSWDNAAKSVNCSRGG